MMVLVLRHQVSRSVCDVKVHWPFGLLQLKGCLAGHCHAKGRSYSASAFSGLLAGALAHVLIRTTVANTTMSISRLMTTAVAVPVADSDVRVVPVSYTHLRAHETRH